MRLLTMLSGIMGRLTATRLFLVVYWASWSEGMRTHVLSPETFGIISTPPSLEREEFPLPTTERPKWTRRRTRRSNQRWYELDSTCLDLNPSASCKLESYCPEEDRALPFTPCRLASNRPSLFGRSILGRFSAAAPQRSYCCRSKVLQADNFPAPQGKQEVTRSESPERLSSGQATILPVDYTGNQSSGPTTDDTASQPRISDLDVIPYFRADIFSLDSESTPASRSVKSPGKAIRKYVSKKRPNTTDVTSENQETTCGQRDLTYKMVRVGRIVGGETAGFSDWPWMAMLLNYGRPRCGATLIAPQVVVTAAHCVSGNRLLTNLTVKLGMFNTNERDNVLFPPVLLRVARAIRHPDFDLTTLLNDVAIIQLSEPVKYAPNMQPICVASQEPVAGWNTTILGWGKEEENNTVYDLPSALQAVNIPLIEREDCSRYFAQQGLKNLIGAPHICAGAKEGGRDACQGDSGGPMVREDATGRFELIGVISWGFGCGEPNVPGVYTNIFHYRDWLVETIRTL